MPDFILPELGENITSGDIVNVLVHEGDLLAVNDGVLELETDKAVVEIPCKYAGKVTKIHVKKGETVKVGQLLMTIEEASPSTLNSTPILSMAESKEESKDVLKKSETNSVDVEIPNAPLPATEAKYAETTTPIPAGPASRRLARELGVNLRQVPGSGQHGRITPEDVQSAATMPPLPSFGTEPIVTPRERIFPPGEPGRDSWGAIRREKMSKIRRTIAAQMVKSATTIPHVTNFDDADITDLEHLRKNVPPGYLGPQVKLTTMPFVLKAVGLALLQHPILSASLDEDKEEIVYKQYVNLGIAVDTPRGLIVPVMRNVDRMRLPDIAIELGLLSQKVRNTDFAIEDLRGGCFTVSNLGAIGGIYSTPIINHPEVAILLLGRSRWQLAIREGKVENRLMLPLSLSFDHRVVDGATAGRFLNDVIDFLQNPGKLLLAPV